MSPLTTSIKAIIAITMCLVAMTVAAIASPRVEPLLPGDFTGDGAWHVFFLPNLSPGKIVRVAELDMAADKLVVRIDGKVQRLARKSEQWTPKRNAGPRPGDECTEIWANPKVTVTLKYKLVKEGYESSSYAGKMTVSTGGGSSSLDVEGESGC